MKEEKKEDSKGQDEVLPQVEEVKEPGEDEKIQALYEKEMGFSLVVWELILH